VAVCIEFFKTLDINLRNVPLDRRLGISIVLHFLKTPSSVPSNVPLLSTSRLRRSTTTATASVYHRVCAVVFSLLNTRRSNLKVKSFAPYTTVFFIKYKKEYIFEFSNQTNVHAVHNFLQKVTTKIVLTNQD